MTRYIGLRKVLRVKQKGLCCYCDVPLVFPPKKERRAQTRVPSNYETVEHLRRKAEGGTSHHDNIALACHDCNSGRGSMDWLTYKSFKMGELT